jgi:LPXTG-motif cell wall-anchored protein
VQAEIQQLLKETDMAETDRIGYLRTALLLVGLIFIFGIYPLTIVWPSGWSWNTGQSDYLLMILGVYATLGVFLLLARRNPLAHLSLIWFTVWSSVVHGAIMAAESLASAEKMGHLWGDVLALFVVAGVLALLTPRGATAQPA